jgi:uncharacterized protein
MMASRPLGPWLVPGLLFLVVPVVVTGVTGLWVFTAIPIGFLFGFFLQKGDLCGASAISEVILFRDRRKMFGLWVAIVTSMVGFAVLDLTGLVQLNIKPLLWLSMSAGGIVFGVGTVLAGGCVSGCLYKAGTGNLNSMAALVAIPIGVGIVETGPLSGLNKAMKSLVVKNAEGGPVSLASVLGVPFWGVALGVAVAAMAAVLIYRRRHAGEQAKQRPFRLSLRHSWKPWQAGIAIGILGALAWLSSAASGRNYPLGVTHGVYFPAVLAFHDSPQPVFQKTEAAPVAASPAEPSKVANVAPRPKVVWWLVALVGSLVFGSFVSARMSGQVKFLPRPPEETVIAFFGGILVGLGAGAAKGCVVGNIISGVGLLSVGTMIFFVFTVLSNWVATWFYLMGGTLNFRCTEAE